MAVALTAAAALGACRGPGGPTESDVRPEEAAAFPGATQLSRSFREEERARGVDGNDLSSEALLARRYRLASPVRTAEVFDWYEGRFDDAGWIRRARNPGFLTFAVLVGDREHRFTVFTATTPTITEYATEYRIGFAGVEPGG
ncbi:MAG TPA: hypothetical protein VNA20_05130 [Frankiaceae bacterium]|nr:hypothetical protein [Frankiaceae bacterium]